MKCSFNTQNGFALMDLLLASVLLIMISAGIYALLDVYKKKAAVQTVEHDLIRIAQAYAPILNQTAIPATNPIMSLGGFTISTAFLKSIPIPDERISQPDFNTSPPGSYLLTNLAVTGTWSNVSFESLSTSATTTTPAIRYLIMGMLVTCKDAAQIIQDLNNSFSLFIGKGSVDVKSANPIKSLPNCRDYGGDTGAVSLFVITPNLSSTKNLVGQYTPSDPGRT